MKNDNFYDVLIPITFARLKNIHHSTGTFKSRFARNATETCKTYVTSPMRYSSIAQILEVIELE